MGFFEKIKNVLFDDGDDIIIEDEKLDDDRKQVEEVHSKREEKKNTTTVSIPKDDEKKEESVFQEFNEEEFDRMAAINKNRLLERDRLAREEKAREQKLKEERQLQEKRLNEYHNGRTETHQGLSPIKDTREKKDDTLVKQDIYNKPLKKEEVKKFTPSPVISPVYGVLGENYRKEDILPRASSEGTLPKVMDVDNVRKKAFGILEQSISSEEPLKKFKGEDELSIEEMSNELEATDDIIKRSDVLDDVEDVVSDKTSNYNLENNNPPTREEDSLEKDLFNLIDSMYENKEEK